MRKKIKSPQITISKLQREILEKITRQTTSSVREIARSKLILAINEGLSNTYTLSKFTAAAYCQILGVALEAPDLSERPISEWSLNELKDEVEKRAIVSSISRSQLGIFLKSERFKATQSGGLDESKM